MTDRKRILPNPPKPRAYVDFEGDGKEWEAAYDMDQLYAYAQKCLRAQSKTFTTKGKK